MIAQETVDNLKALHKGGFGGILDIVLRHKTFRKWPFVCSAIISILILAVLLFMNDDGIFFVLKETADIITAVFPGLLGFSLGGYAIAVGFSNNDLIKYSTRSDKHNIYQLLSGIFALSIVFQALATIAGFLISWLIKIHVNELFQFLYFSIGATVINAILFFFLFFTSVYSLILTPYIITNLFTLSQLNSMHFTLEKIKEEEKKKNQQV